MTVSTMNSLLLLRHVDNVMFENPEIVESFLSFWRHTGSQRVGFLYGVYEPFPEVSQFEIFRVFHSKCNF